MQTEQFLGKEYSFSASENSAMPMRGKTESVASLGMEMTESYVELARTNAFLSEAHKAKAETFFKDALGMDMPTSEEFADMKTEDMTFPNNDALYTTIVRNMELSAESPLNY